jgi:hypothetical protein
MPRLRPRLIAGVIALPLFLFSYVTWSVADDPVVNLKDWGVGNYTPLWWGAGLVIRACLPIVVLAIIPAALVVARLRARRQRTWAAAGNGVAAAIVVIGAAVFFSAIAGRPDSAPPIPQIDLVALALSVLAGLAVLANAAARAQPDRRTARLVIVPATLLSIVLLATFIALVAYASDLAVHGVPLMADLGVRVYPIDALPTRAADLLPALIVSVVASLAALFSSAYALAGAIRVAQTKAEPDVTRAEPDADILIELDIAQS